MLMFEYMNENKNIKNVNFFSGWKNQQNEKKNPFSVNNFTIKYNLYLVWWLNMVF